MLSRVLVLAAVLCAATAGSAVAQKTAPRITRDVDRDGVPDMRDRCPGTAVGITVNATGCQAAAPAPPQQQAAVVPPAAPPPAAQSDTARPRHADSAAAKGAPPSGLPALPAGPPAAPGAAEAKPPAVVVTQSVPVPVGLPSGGGAPAPGAPAAPAPTAPARAEAIVADVGAPTVTGGFFMAPPAARSDSGRLEYLRLYALRLDSAIAALIEVYFRTAPAQAAADPSQVSSRVRERWMNCRNIYFDLVSFGDAMLMVKDSLPANPLLAQAATRLSDALEGTGAIQECDNVVSAIEAPTRWSPWADHYARSIQQFYRNWYTQLRAVHEADRTLVRALNTMLPAERRLAPIGALPPTPPTL